MKKAKEKTEEKNNNGVIPGGVTTNTGGEIVRTLFSYLNNYSEDGSTIRHKQTLPTPLIQIQPVAAAAATTATSSSPRRHSSFILPLFNRRLINIGSNKNNANDMRLVESSLTFKTTSNYRVNSSGSSETRRAAAVGESTTTGNTKSTDAAVGVQQPVMLINSNTSSSSSSGSSSSSNTDIHTAEEKLQLTRKNKIITKVILILIN